MRHKLECRWEIAPYSLVSCTPIQWNLFHVFLMSFHRKFGHCGSIYSLCLKKKELFGKVVLDLAQFCFTTSVTKKKNLFRFWVYKRNVHQCSHSSVLPHQSLWYSYRFTVFWIFCHISRKMQCGRYGLVICLHSLLMIVMITRITFRPYFNIFSMCTRNLSPF